MLYKLLGIKLDNAVRFCILHTHLAVITIKQTQETGLGSSGSLDPTKSQIIPGPR